MQAQHGIEAVEQPPQLDDVLPLHGSRVELTEEPPQPVDLVLDLGVRAAQGSRGLGVPERAGHERQEQPLVLALVGHEGRLQPFEELPCRGEVGILRGEPVGDGADLLDLGQDGVVVGAKALGERDVLVRERQAVHAPREDGAQRQGDGQHVDALLEHRARCGGQQACRGRDHRDTREPHPHDHGLEGDGLRAAGDEDRVGKGIDPVDREHDVGCLGGRRRAPCGESDTDAGSGQRGGVVDAVADHDRSGPDRLLLDHRELVRRGAVRQDGVDADHPADRAGDVGAVAGDEDHALEPCGAQRTHHARRVGTDGVLEEHRPRGGAVDRGEHGHRPVEVGTPVHLPDPGRGHVPDDPGGLAEPDLVPVDQATDAVPVLLAHVGGHDEGQTATVGRRDDGVRQHVGRHLVERRREPKHGVCVDVRAGGHHARHRGPPLGQGARLVEEHDPSPGEPFEGTPTLDDDAPTGGAGQTGHDGDGGGEQERARSRDDEYRDGAHRVTRQRPRPCRQGEREGNEQHREPVGGADERGGGGLGLLNQPDDAGVRRLRGDRGGEEVDRVAGIDDTAADLVPRCALDGQALAREGRLVEQSRPDQPTVDRHDLAGADEEAVATHDVVDGHVLDCLGESAVRDARSTGGKEPEVPASTGCGPGLEQLARGEHHGDHGAGEGLPHRQCARQGQDGDHVDGGLSAAQGGHRPRERGDEAEGRAREPERVGHPVGAEQPPGSPGEKEAERGQEKQQSGPLA